MALPNGFESSEELVKAHAHIWEEASGFKNSMSLKCAIQLGIPDIIHKHGKAMTLAELAGAMPINQSKSESLRRLMNLLVHTKFFKGDGEAGYCLTPSSLLLLRDEPLSVAPLVLSMLDPLMVDAWDHMSTWFAMDDATPFITAHGAPLFKATGSDGRLNRVFNEAMASDSRLVATVMVRDCREVFNGVGSMVDVGGGTGATAKALVDAFPGLNCTVLDLPHVVAGLKGTRKLNYIGGDMFEAIPPADVVFLKWIMHNWNDEECVKILKQCKRVIPSKEKGGKVVIMDMVVSHNTNDYEAIETQLKWDVMMMVLTSGKERTQQDWENLLRRAGFISHKITPLLGFRSIIEAFV